MNAEKCEPVPLSTVGVKAVSESDKCAYLGESEIVLRNRYKDILQL